MPVQAMVDYAVAELNDGSELRTPFWRLDSGEQGEVLLVMAGQHGNELQGCEVIRRFKEVCEQQLVQGTVYLLPFANLLAVRHRRPHVGLGPEQKYVEDGNTNMQRFWPGDPRGTDVARVVYALDRRILRHCTRMIDLHSWNRFWATATLASPTSAAGRAMGEVTGTRFLRWWGGSAAAGLPTTNSSLVHRRGGASVTLELAGQYALCEREVTQGLRAVINVARLLSLLEGAPELPEGPRAVISEQTSHEVHAPCSGLFVEAGLAPEDHVEAGQRLGHLIRDTDLATVEVVSPMSGYLWKYGCHRAECDVRLPDQHPYATEGDMLALVVTV